MDREIRKLGRDENNLVKLSFYDIKCGVYTDPGLFYYLWNDAVFFM